MTRNDKLKLALAKMLPENLRIVKGLRGNDIVEWVGQGFLVADTEWLHVCWLIEQSLDDEEFIQFSDNLTKARLIRAETSYTKAERETISASWEQRAEALMNLTCSPATEAEKAGQAEV